ncbi:hypothetical protein Dimus_034458 [Dionaea muscipula]
MLLAVFLALFLPCAGMSAVFIVYMCLLWYSVGLGGIRGGMRRYGQGQDEFGKPMSRRGLTPAELEKLPRVSGKELVLGTECAVCLDEIASEQPARLVPGCNHGFHLHCADTWLSKHPACPVCRTTLGPDFFPSSIHAPC